MKHQKLPEDPLKRADFLLAELGPKIVFEDRQLLVVDKPSGLVVNRVDSSRAKTLQDWIEENLKVSREGGVSRVPQARDTRGTLDSSDTFLKRSGIVHRLDKETSGLLIVAKTPESFLNLQSQFKQRVVKKTYLALVHGWPSPRAGEIKLPISRSRFNRKKFGIFLGGRPSETKYRLKKTYSLKEKQYALLALSPVTGRTHQIRVHLKAIGHPVVADTKYAGRKTLRDDQVWCRRLFLHATRLIFNHPKTGKRVEFESPLPDQLESVLDYLG